MPAQIPDSIADWSTTAGSNQPSGSANVGPDLDDNLRAMQVAVRQTYTRGSIASAATCDIGTVDAELITVTGTTGISSLGTTLGATGYGVHKLLTFAGALTLTHSTSLACITSANITTAAGDSCMVEYSASGWTMLWFARKSGQTVAGSVTFADGTVALPGIAFAADADTGLYRIGANNLGIALNGVKYGDFATSLFAFTPGGSTYNFGAALALTAAGAITLTSANASAITLQGGTGGAQANVNILSGGQGVINVTAASGNGASRANVNITSGGMTGAFGGGTQAGTVTITSGAHSDNSNGSLGGDIVLNAQGNTSGRSACGGALKLQITPQSTTYTVAQVSGNTGAFVYDSSYGTPSIVSGAGTGAAIVGTNYGFTITLGTTPGASIVVNFSTWRGLTGAPSLACAIPVYQGASTVEAQLSASSSSQLTIALSATPTAGDKVHVMAQFYA